MTKKYDAKPYKQMTPEERDEKYPVLRFDCANCGKSVIVVNTYERDKRTRFCCAECERAFWRKATRHPTHLTNHQAWEVFADVNKYDR